MAQRRRRYDNGAAARTSFGMADRSFRLAQTFNSKTLLYAIGITASALLAASLVANFDVLVDGNLGQAISDLSRNPAVIGEWLLEAGRNTIAFADTKPAEFLGSIISGAGSFFAASAALDARRSRNELRKAEERELLRMEESVADYNILQVSHTRYIEEQTADGETVFRQKFTGKGEFKVEDFIDRNVEVTRQIIKHAFIYCSTKDNDVRSTSELSWVRKGEQRTESLFEAIEQVLARDPAFAHLRKKGIVTAETVNDMLRRNMQNKLGDTLIGKGMPEDIFFDVRIERTKNTKMRILTVDADYVNGDKALPTRDQVVTTSNRKPVVDAAGRPNPTINRPDLTKQTHDPEAEHTHFQRLETITDIVENLQAAGNARFAVAVEIEDPQVAIEAALDTANTTIAVLEDTVLRLATMNAAIARKAGLDPAEFGFGAGPR